MKSAIEYFVFRLWAWARSIPIDGLGFVFDHFCKMTQLNYFQTVLGLVFD